MIAGRIIAGNRWLAASISEEMPKCILSKSTSGLRFSDPARKTTQNVGGFVGIGSIFVLVSNFSTSEVCQLF